MLRAKRKIGALVILLIGAGNAASQEPTKERVDSLGDPLPKQALFRIGTTRLQHQGQIQALAVSNDGKLIASCGREKVVRVWDVRDGKPLWKFEVPSWGPWALAFSRQGKELAAVSRSPENSKAKGTFRRWDLTTGRELPPAAAVADSSLHFTYHVALVHRGDGKYLAAETTEQDISLYSPGTPKSGKTLKGHTGRVMSLCFTNDAKTLVSLGDEGMIRFWNIDDGKEIAKLPSPSMKGQSLKGNLAFLAVSPDGKTLAVSLPDGSTRLLDAAGQELRRLRSSEQMNALAFSPNGKALMTGGNLVESWNVSDAEPIALVKQSRNPLRALSLSPDGKIAACADNRDRLRWVEIGTGKVRLQREIPCRGGIAFSPKGRLFAAAPGNDTIALWDVAPLSAPEKPLRSEPAIRLRCKGKVDAFVFSPNGKRLATVEEGKCTRIYEIASRKADQTFQPSGRKVYAVAFSADGKLLATMGEQSSFRGELNVTVPQSVGLWDTLTGKELTIGEDLRRTAHTVVFHPNGKALAALHLPDIAKDAPQSGFMPIGFQAIPVERRMETIRLWSTGFTRERFRFEDPIHRKNAESAGAWIIGRSQPVAAAFSPDGWLFAAPGPGGIVLFETTTGQPRLRLAGHLNEITGLAFTPDGNTLVSTSHDSTLLIWDVTGLRTNAKLPGDGEELWGLLANTNAEKAGRAIFAMVEAPAASLALLRKRLHAVSVSEAGLQKLIAELDDPTFAVRQKAARELAMLGPLAETALTKKLQAKPSLEASRRIKELLAGLKSKRPGTDQIRAIRAVEVLERIGSREADVLLAELAAGSEGAYLTDHAREAIERRKRRSVEEPAKKRGP